MAHTVNVKDDDIPNLVLGSTKVVVKENAIKVGVKIKMDKAVTTNSSIRLFVKDQGDSTLIPGEFSLGSSTTDLIWVNQPVQTVLPSMPRSPMTST